MARAPFNLNYWSFNYVLLKAVFVSICIYHTHREECYITVC